MSPSSYVNLLYLIVSETNSHAPSHHDVIQYRLIWLYSFLLFPKTWARISRDEEITIMIVEMEAIVGSI